MLFILFYTVIIISRIFPFYRQPNNRFKFPLNLLFPYLSIFLNVYPSFLDFCKYASRFIRPLLSLSLSFSYTYIHCLSFPPSLSHEQNGTTRDDSYLFQMHSAPSVSSSLVNVSCCTPRFSVLHSDDNSRADDDDDKLQRMRQSVGNVLPRESPQVLRAARLRDPLGRRLSTFDAISRLTAFLDIPMKVFGDRICILNGKHGDKEADLISNEAIK